MTFSHWLLSAVFSYSRFSILISMADARAFTHTRQKKPIFMLLPRYASAPAAAALPRHAAKRLMWRLLCGPRHCHDSAALAIPPLVVKSAAHVLYYTWPGNFADTFDALKRCRRSLIATSQHYHTLLVPDLIAGRRFLASTRIGIIFSPEAIEDDADSAPTRFVAFSARRCARLAPPCRLPPKPPSRDIAPELDDGAMKERRWRHIISRSLTQAPISARRFDA